MKSKIAILFTILVLIITSGFSCKCSSPEVAEKTKPIKLTWWRPWDSSADVSDIINAYTQLHPHVSISYKKFRYEEYEDALINGWAQDEGPDIFSLNNSWLRKYQKNIAPPPEETAVPRIVVTGPSFKQEFREYLKSLNL